MTQYHRGLFVGFLAAQAHLAGCSYEHVETIGNGQTPEWEMPQPASPPVALYAIPLINPKGKVCVRSLGPEQLVVSEQRPRYFLHIAMALENAADVETWTIDSRDMKLNLVGSSRPLPAYSKTLQKSATLAIPQGKRGQLDLYFPSGSRSRPLHFSFLWKLHRGSKTDTISTRFDNAGAISTVNEDSDASTACGRLSRVADRHATVGLLTGGNPI